jgi:hypothetical protein
MLQGVFHSSDELVDHIFSLLQFRAHNGLHRSRIIDNNSDDSKLSIDSATIPTAYYNDTSSMLTLGVSSILLRRFFSTLK